MHRIIGLIIVWIIKYRAKPKRLYDLIFEINHKNSQEAALYGTYFLIFLLVIGLILATMKLT